MLTFTLDTNCIIDIVEDRKGAAAVRALSNAHAKHVADVALVAVSASERQSGDKYLHSYADFTSRIQTLGLGHLPILSALAYWDIGFWDIGIWPSETMVDRERLIHTTLFPTIPFSWPDFAKMMGVPSETLNIPQAKRWRNAFCDRQMFWAHDHNRRDIFVTSDVNFRDKLSTSNEFRSAQIKTPDEALAML